MDNKLVCQECDYSESVPMHCGQEMHIEVVNGQEMFICHMGPGCGKQDLSMHHGKPMKIVTAD